MGLDKSQLLNLIGAALPHIVSAVRQIREVNPESTDEDIIRTLRADSLRIIDEANAWLAQHPDQQAAEGYTTFGKEPEEPEDPDEEDDDDEDDEDNEDDEDEDDEDEADKS